MSGMSNVKYWLELRGIAFNDELAKEILTLAKSCPTTLSEGEIIAVVEKFRGSGQEGGRPPGPSARA